MTGQPAIRKTVRTLFLLALIMTAIVCFALLFSAPRIWLITFIEKNILHREIQHEKWVPFLFRAAFGECVLAAGAAFFCKKFLSKAARLRWYAGITAVCLVISSLYMATSVRLEGAINIPPRPDLSIETLLDGTFQTGFDKYFSFVFPPRVSMTLLYNQILYTLFDSTDSKNIIIGKDNYLYEPGYFDRYLLEATNEQEQSLRENIQTLVKLETMLKKRGKSFAVLVTPSKASLYSENAPSCYTPYIQRKRQGSRGDNYYDVFKRCCKEIDFEYLDTTEISLRDKEAGRIVFTAGGIHWTGGAMTSFLPAFIEYLNKRTPSPIGSIVVSSEIIRHNQPFITDGDLETLMNLAFPRYNFPSAHIETVSQPSDFRPRVFLCGGSFNWQWLYSIFGMKESINHNGPIFLPVEFSWYNWYILRFPDDIKIAEQTDNFAAVMENDIILIELNEGSIEPNAVHFDFAENLLNYLTDLEKSEGAN